MMKFKMTCTCGDVIEVEAASQEEAVEKCKAMTTEASLSSHFAQKHPGQTPPALADALAGVAMMVTQA